VLVGDITSTGSIVKARALLRRKSGKIYLMYYYSLINENNIRKILDTGVENINTMNSLPYRFAEISPTLASCIAKEIH
jgi:phosphoribosylpyrophosphate synthetase